MVSFGVAPALIAYEWMLRGLGKLGWMVAFIYCAGAVMRLARFNTMIGVTDRAGSSACPARRRRRWWPAWCGFATPTATTDLLT